MAVGNFYSYHAILNQTESARLKSGRLIFPASTKFTETRNNEL